MKCNRLYGGGLACLLATGFELASANPYHRGPFQVYLDGKLIWQSGWQLEARLLQQAIVDIPAGSSTISLNVVHDMTSGVWGQAGFMKE